MEYWKFQLHLFLPPLFIYFLTKNGGHLVFVLRQAGLPSQWALRYSLNASRSYRYALLNISFSHLIRIFCYFIIYIGGHLGFCIYDTWIFLWILCEMLQGVIKIHSWKQRRVMFIFSKHFAIVSTQIGGHLESASSEFSTPGIFRDFMSHASVGCRDAFLKISAFSIFFPKSSYRQHPNQRPS